jgi:hypothetical protein
VRESVNYKKQDHNTIMMQRDRLYAMMWRRKHRILILDIFSCRLVSLCVTEKKACCQYAVD